MSDGNQTVPLQIGAGENVEAAWPDTLSSNAELEFLNPAWFDANNFRVIRLASFDKVSLAKAECIYHLEMMKQLAR